MINLLTEPHQMHVAGDMQAADVPQLTTAFSGVTDTLELHLGEMDISDGTAMAGFTRLLTDALDRGCQLTLIESPQLLVHNLYRVGRYPHPRLTVIDMREEEAYG